MTRKLALCCWLVWGLLYAQERQPIYQLSQHSPAYHAFTHCTLVISPGEQIEDATLVIKDGVITAVGTALPVPEGALEHDLKGYWIYPGLIDAYAKYGQEVERTRFNFRAPPQYESKREGPYHWNQAVNSHLNLADGFKPKDKEAQALRNLGFTTAQIVPRDGIFRGQGIVAHLGANAQGNQILAEQAAHGLSFSKGSSGQAYPSSLMGAIALIRQTLLDADWYIQAQAAMTANPQQKAYERNLSLENWNQGRSAELPIIFETGDIASTFRAAEISKEFDLPLIFKTDGKEYQQLDKVLGLESWFIVPLNFPEAYKVEDYADAHEISLVQLREWELAPSNPARMAAAAIPFALTTDGLSLDKFYGNLRKAMKAGLSETQALTALTTGPAEMLGLSEIIGTLEKGKQADFIISSGNLFREKTEIYSVYVQGTEYQKKARPTANLIGDWEWELDGTSYRLSLSGAPSKPQAKVFVGEDTTAWKSAFSQSQQQFQLNFQKGPAFFSMRGFADGENLNGTGEDAAGQRFSFSAARTATKSKQRKGNKRPPPPPPQRRPAPVPYPLNGYGRNSIPAQENLLIRGATVWTNTDEGILEETDVLIQNGKIAGIGNGLRVSRDVTIIEANGLHLTTGVIDEHSHIAATRGINEGTHSISSEVRIGDVINPNDVNIYRQLAGGTTTSQILHGSANPIGGQSQIIKLRWGADAEGLKYESAPQFIKFALGENVKRANSTNRIRYPQTRMGVEQLIKDAFRAAKDYEAAWEEWNSSGKANNMIPPRRDLQLEALVEILKDERFITCHSYVQSEITMLMRLAEAEGFRVNTFTHILEGYKVADKMAEHGVFGSTFSDWWAYKYEVIDAIPYNAALMHQAGVGVCINSDDREMARRLNQEAAKTVMYGGVSEEDAWKMVTLNPAQALHIDDRVGSIKIGMDADLVLWNNHPMSIYARPIHCWIDGRRYFDQKADEQMRMSIQAERQRILALMRKEAGKGGRKFPGRRPNRDYHCDTMEDYGAY